MAYGERLITSLIDSIAHEDPSRAWASVPKDDNNLSDGFVEVSYKQLANAVNHAAWWLTENLPRGTSTFETIAYTGPKDLRYPILAVAASKVGKQLLLPSPFATSEAQMHVLNVTKCKTYLHAAAMKPVVDRVLREGTDIRTVPVPEISDWLVREESRGFPYNKSWEEGRRDPWLIFHTSGTTGLPKPIVYTNQMMASLDAAKTMPDADRETMINHFQNSRWYTPLPTLHFVGMTVTLQMTVFLNTVVVVGPANSGLITPASVREVLEFGNVAGVMLPPSLVEPLCHDSEGLKQLRKLKYIYFAGAPLPASVADKLVDHVPVKPAMGSTEAGAYFLQICGNEDWEYYSFRPGMGVEFEQRTAELYELVFVRKPELARWQQIFQVYPHLDRFCTKDLWTKHATKPGMWRYAGRTDDLIIFSHGEDLYASEIEAAIEKHPEVAAALIGGQGRPRPFLIVEWKDQSEESKGRLDKLWPVVEEANRRCSDYVKLSRPLIFFTDHAKPLVRTTKGTVSRRQNLELYATEIDRLYKG